MKLAFGARSADLSHPHVMGILNVTPDSFSDGGRFTGPDRVAQALKHAESMLLDGATFIDVGGESTRPGAPAVSLQEEMDRVLPVVEAIANSLGCIVSVDTSSPKVMSEAASLGAGMLNDVRALTRDGALDAAQATGLPVCLMHMRGQPVNMQDAPAYTSVVDDVRRFLAERVAACVDNGIPSQNIILDPGFGFGKTDDHNLDLLKQLQTIKIGASPLLVGLSRKSLIGRILGREVHERLPGSLALAQYALQYGATILRVHDVGATVDIVKMYRALHEPGITHGEKPS